MNTSTTRRSLATVLVVIAAIGASACSRSVDALADRRHAVATKSAKVMPFDLDATTHRFWPKPSGGVQQVLSDDPTNVVQIDLVRAHLQQELTKFQRGDFSDPSSIHGDAMPGVAELSKAGRDGSLTVSFEALPDGAQLIFTSDAPGVVAALQRWFRAQKSDHGAHIAP